jgi:protein-L-isoaspartate(D-aspartate) O-methyltransferase
VLANSQQDLTGAVVAAGITDERLIEAFRRIPREDFVPDHSRDVAYEDRPIPIAHDQVTTQPSLSAMMIEALDLKPTDRVLEVGTGLGFQTALLAYVAGHVVTIEAWRDLGDQATANLRHQGIGNVETKIGDGSVGVPESAPYDAVLVSAAFPKVPDPLAEQLAEGGRLVQPIGSGGDEIVTLYMRAADGLRPVRSVTPARFVRLVGLEAFPSDET